MPALSRRQQKIREKEKKAVAEQKLKRESYVNQTPFRNAERNFKSRFPEPDFSKVIDLETVQDGNPTVVKTCLKQSLSSEHFGKCSEEAYIIASIPGLIVIPSAFSPQAQRRLIRHCVRDYARPPNTSNLDTHYVIPSSGLWELHEQQMRGECDPNYCIPKKSDKQKGQEEKEEEEEEEEEAEQQQKVETCLVEQKACADNFNPKVNVKKADPPPADTVPELPPSKLIYKMRWITLGYQYHWPTKTYHFDRRYPMPEDVSEITREVVTAVEDVGYGDWKNTYRGSDFKAEAGVINYYQYRDTLMGHVDRSELNMQAPLVSISLGNDCIYLIGGTTRDVEPIALRLHSGDVIVMTEPCRKCFHGVPLIIENTLPKYLSASVDETDWKLYGEYMKTTRINLNIRQVFQPL